MATLRNKRKLAALNKENCEKHPMSNLAQNSNAPRSQEDYITQISEEIEGRVTKKLSQEFNRTENRILGALSRLHDFLFNPLFQGYSGTAPETSRNAYGANQGTNEDDSQSDSHPEASQETLAQKSRTTDSEKIRADQRWCFSCSLNQRWKTSKLRNSAVQRWLSLGLQPGLDWSQKDFEEKCLNLQEKSY